MYTARCHVSFPTGSSLMPVAWMNMYRRSTRSAGYHNTIASWKAALSSLEHRLRISDTLETNIEHHLGIGVRNARIHSLLLKNFSDTTRSMTRITYHLRPNRVVADVEKSSTTYPTDGEHEDPHREQLQM